MREEVDGKRGVIWAPITRKRCYRDLDPVTLPEHKERMDERRVEGPDVGGLREDLFDIVQLTEPRTKS